MSYRVDIEITDIKLKIPKKDFPLNSDLIVGYKKPSLVYQDDECSESSISPTEEEDCFVWMEGFCGCDTTCACWIDELKELCKKYKGVLIVECCGEEGDMEYIRIRDGKEKKVRIVEED